MVAMNKIILQLFDVLDMGYARVVLGQEDPSDFQVVLLSGMDVKLMLTLDDPARQISIHGGNSI